MHAVDLYWLVGPIETGEGAPLLPLVLCFVGVGGLFTAAACWHLRRSPLVPVKDPRLAESLRFENV